MRLLTLTASVTAAALLVSLLFAAAGDAVGVASTIAIIPGDAPVVCGVLAETSLRSVLCSAISAAGAGQPFALLPNVSFASVSGGSASLCALRSDGAAFFCWGSGGDFSASARLPKRVYLKGTAPLRDLAVGEEQVAASDRNGTFIEWWRADERFPSRVYGNFRSLTSGGGFSCAIDRNGSVDCWGPQGDTIRRDFANQTMSTVVAGDSHACGISNAGLLVCDRSNISGQLTTPPSAPFEFGSLALGSSHACAVRRSNGTVVCWDGGGDPPYAPAGDIAFEFVVAGGNLTCGLTRANYSVQCWRADRRNPHVTTLPSPEILPGICTANLSSCECGPASFSEKLCSDTGVICKQFCDPDHSPLPPSPPSPSSSKTTSKRWLAYVIVGSVGTFAGICSIIFFLWFGVCRNKKVHNSVQPSIAATGNGGSHAMTSSPPGVTSPFISPNGSKSRIFRRQGSRIMSRQRSGPSSLKDRAVEFGLAELAAATKDFSLENKIGAGSFGTVYKGKLTDGREVAIKRCESGVRTKKFQEKESAFQSELAFLSRLHHKHLVGLIGYCDEREERLLVYEYMKNGALYDHLHPKDDKAPNTLNSWKMRIKLMLDAARGVEYLHNYAVPPIIHRDIKSSNILIDGNWVARVSDFGLSLMGPESEDMHLSMKAAGTVGYMDPEYYGLHHLTVKSDVYGFGVVMLEVLTGKRAIFKENGGSPMSLVDHTLPSIVAGEITKLLDTRVEQPGAPEEEALELVAYTAVHCVKLEGRERPSMTDIVANLESALALCEERDSSISNASISLPSAD